MSSEERWQDRACPAQVRELVEDHQGHAVTAEPEQRLESHVPVGKGKRRWSAQMAGNRFAEHPQRLGLRGLDRLEIEPAECFRQCAEQVGLALPTPPRYDAQQRLRSAVTAEVDQHTPLGVSVEHVLRLVGHFCMIVKYSPYNYSSMKCGPPYRGSGPGTVGTERTSASNCASSSRSAGRSVKLSRT